MDKVEDEGKVSDYILNAPATGHYFVLFKYKPFAVEVVICYNT